MPATYDRRSFTALPPMVLIARVLRARPGRTSRGLRSGDTQRGNKDGELGC